MIQLTPPAQNAQSVYLQEVRTHLYASGTANPDEILRDVEEHIQTELHERPQPVSAEDMAAVLTRLGSPRQWALEEDQPWWTRMTARLRRGPEDWRLAYLSLGVLIFGTPLSGPLGVLGSFVLARAALSVSDPAELKNKRWIIYPSLIITYVLLLALLLGVLVVIGVPSYLVLSDSISRWLSHDPSSPYIYYPLLGSDQPGNVLVFGAIVALGLAALSALLWRVNRRWPGMIRILFRPFADNWQPRWFGWTALWLIVLALIMGGVAGLLWAYGPVVDATPRFHS